VSDASVQVAAKAVGVCRSTAHVWVQQPAFQKELARRRDAALAEARAGVRSQAGLAAAKLATLLEAEDGRLCRMVCNDIEPRHPAARHGRVRPPVAHPGRNNRTDAEDENRMNPLLRQLVRLDGKVGQ